MSEIKPDQLNRFRTVLQDRAGVLRGEVREVEQDRSEALQTARDNVEDQGDQAEDRREDEVRNAEEDRDEGELREIDAALSRIDDGLYGECIDCGIDIPLARLEARPAAVRCIECQQRLENA